MKSLVIGLIVGFVLTRLGVPLGLIVAAYILLLLYVVGLYVWEEYIR